MAAKPSIFSVIKSAAADWWEDNCLRLSAALSYYTALSLAPLLLLVVAIAGLVWGREAVSGQLAQQMGGLMGDSGKKIVETVLQNASEQKAGVITTVVGTVMLIFAATGVFGELQSAMNIIWEVKPKPAGSIWGGIWTWLRQRLLSFTMVLVIAFLLLVSLVITAALGAVSNAIGGGTSGEILGHAINLAISIPVLTALFALLFKFIPDAEVKWRDVWIGAFFSALLFTVGKFAIGLYLGHASVGSAYGAAGSLIVMLVWVYYSSLILFFGAEFTQAWANRTRVVQPKAEIAEKGAAPQKKGEARQGAKGRQEERGEARRPSDRESWPKRTTGA